jgi:hypothetical protein
MKIAKPLLLVTTPLGLLEGFYEAYQVAGELLFLMVAMVGVVGIGFATVIATVRREEREQASRSPIGRGVDPGVDPGISPEISPGISQGIRPDIRRRIGQGVAP